MGLHLDDPQVLLKDEVLQVSVLYRESVEEGHLLLRYQLLFDERLLHDPCNVFVGEVLPKVTKENGFLLLLILFFVLRLFFFNFLQIFFLLFADNVLDWLKEYRADFGQNGLLEAQ